MLTQKTRLEELKQQVDDAQNVIVDEQGAIILPEVSWEELKQRLDKRLGIVVDERGRLMSADSPEAQQLPSDKKILVKLIRWFGTNSEQEEVVKNQVKSESQSAYWYELDPVRLGLENKVVEMHFPQFKLRMLDDKRLVWVGTLTSNSNNHYKIAIIYPHRFPKMVLEVFPVDPPIQSIDASGRRYKHQYADGHLSLCYPVDRTFGVNTTAATIIAVAAAWLFAYEYWIKSGKQDWPGIEAS